MFGEKKICNVCGYYGTSKTFGGSSILTELLAWIVAIVLMLPTMGISIWCALIFSVIRFFTRGKGEEGCPSCKNTGCMISLDSPVGQRLYNKYYGYESVDDNQRHFANDSRKPQPQIPASAQPQVAVPIQPATPITTPDLSPNIEVNKSVPSSVEKKRNREPLEKVEVNVSGITDPTQLIKRAKLSLEDGEFAKANAFCEHALNLNAENAEVYLYKLMVEYRVKNKEDLCSLSEPFEESNNYRKVLRFGDDKLKAELESFVEENRKYTIYNKAMSLMGLNDIDSYKKAIELFKSIIEYKDSAERIEQCNTNTNQITYNQACKKMTSATKIEDYVEAIKLFETIKYFKDSDGKIEECNKNIHEIKENTYNKACKKMNNNILNFDYTSSNENAIKLFESIKDFKDSAFKIQDCEYNINRKLKILRTSVIVLICLSLCLGLFIYGKATDKSNFVLTDRDFNVTADNCLSLIRKVEIYQWIEMQQSYPEKQFGGGTTVVKDYKYEKFWSKDVINSNVFAKSNYADNSNSTLDFNGKKLNDIVYQPSKLAILISGKKVDSFKVKPVELQASNLTLPPNAKVIGNVILFNPSGSEVNENAPEIGDIRVTYTKIPLNNENTVIGQNTNNSDKKSISNNSLNSNIGNNSNEKTIIVPNIVGKTVAESSSVLANNHLSWGEIKMEYNDYIPKNQIIEQNPKAGFFSREDRLVHVVVSNGKKIDESITNSESYKNATSCFAKMRNIVLALLYADKKLNKKVTYYDADELVKIGALYQVPVCPDQGCYSVEVIENGRRQIKCSVHGILKNEVPVNQTKPEPKRNAKILSLGRITAKSGLNLRKEPTTKSGKVGSIAFGTEVIVLEKSIKDTIENITSYWYQVTDGEITGWAFGGFLDVNKGLVLIDKDNGFQLKMITCPAGSFMMGSPRNELGRNDDELQHKVTISKSFFIGKFEVTQGQYQTIIGVNPSEIKDDNLPATNISWNDAKDFCDKLNNYYGNDLSSFIKGKYKFDLPTEAQWEYACRAGTTTPFYHSYNRSQSDNDTLVDTAWFKLNSGNTIHTVGQKKPNDWGICDIYGNVYEWCKDWKSNYPSYSVTDPFGLKGTRYRVIRGGSFGDTYEFCRSASRGGCEPNGRSNDIGFRVVLVLDE